MRFPKLIGLIAAVTLFLGVPLAWAINYTTFGTTSTYTSTNLTLSNGNLTGNQTGSSATDQSAMSPDGKTTGILYFEMTFTSNGCSSHNDDGAGVSLNSFTPTNTNTGVAGQAIIYVSGNMYVNGSQSLASGVTITSGVTIGEAFDLTNGYWWVTKDGTHWNSTSVANTPTVNNAGGGGVSISSITSHTLTPIASFGCSGGGSGVGATWTANFGKSAFSYTVPTGFTAGWQSNVQITPGGLGLLGVGM